jgi:multicomponent Na+:H+ antiporter subunit E
MKKLTNIPLRLIRLLFFIAFYFKELVVSSTLLAWDIARPRKTFTHGIVAIDIELKKSSAVIALVNLVSMTPGSLSVYLTPDRKRLFIHAMYLEDPEGFKRKIKSSFERRIKQIFE